LAAAVVALTGPVNPRAAVAAAEQEAWERAFAKLSRAVAGRPQAAGWLERLHRTGVVKRLAGDAEAARELLDRLAKIAEALPAHAEHLGSFAARTAGRAHALDDGEPLGALALGLARALSGLEPPAAGESPAESRREAWAAVGILCDELSNAVLVLGLTGDGQTATGRMLALARDAGQPIWLTLRQLVRDPPDWRNCLDGGVLGGGVLGGGVLGGGVLGGGVAAGGVYVCENPSILALAADAFGPRCPPLVCLGGQPSAATMLLLRSLDAAGAHLRHHGDFDWGGVRIGNVLRARIASVAPWQFDRAAYLDAVSAHPHTGTLSGEPVVAAWDSALSDEMCHVGKRIEEEMVADSLLSALASARVAQAPAMFDRLLNAD
jgi:uncharacterized protein (TIGR02679 family)